LSSGDGGWIHLAPHVADLLASNGYFVVGFNVKRYLTSFTQGDTTLRVQDEPGDYRVLAGFASRASRKKPILIGASVGAGLSVLAATDPDTKAAIAGVVGLGIPELNELGWRWRDSIIYLTHRVPDEPTFSVMAVIGAVCAGSARRDLLHARRFRAGARRAAAVWTPPASRSSSGSCARPTTGSATICRSSIAGCSTPSSGSGSSPCADRPCPSGSVLPCPP
jgi:hypothetical protein